MNSVGGLVKLLVWQIIGWAIPLVLAVAFLAVTNVNGAQTYNGDPTGDALAIYMISTLLAVALIGLYLVGRIFGETSEDKLMWWILIGANTGFCFAGFFTLLEVGG